MTSKNPKKLISRFLVIELFFRNKYVLKVISILCASKRWVAWPFSHYEFDNDQFATLLANLFQLPVWLSVCLEIIVEISVFWASIWARDIYWHVIYTDNSQKKFQETIGRFVLSFCLVTPDINNMTKMESQHPISCNESSEKKVENNLYHT